MPGCVLRAVGVTISVERFLQGSQLRPCATFQKGESGSRASRKGKRSKTSGMNVVVAEGDSLLVQIHHAMAFLKHHRRELMRLRRYPGVELVCLDFGIAVSDEKVAYFVYLPPELLRLAGQLDIGIELSRYVTTGHR